MSNFIKENGGPLVVGAVFLGLVLGYIELRMGPMIDDKLTDAGVVKTSAIVVMKDDIADNEKDIDDLTDRHNGLIDALAQAAATANAGRGGN